MNQIFLVYIVFILRYDFAPLNYKACVPPLDRLHSRWKTLINLIAKLVTKKQNLESNFDNKNLQLKGHESELYNQNSRNHVNVPHCITWAAFNSHLPVTGLMLYRGRRRGWMNACIVCVCLFADQMTRQRMLHVRDQNNTFFSSFSKGNHHSLDQQSRKLPFIPSTINSQE